MKRDQDRDINIDLLGGIGLTGVRTNGERENDNGAGGGVDKNFIAFADAMPVVSWISKPDGSVQFFNKKWYEYTGQAESEALGWGWQCMIHPDDLERVINVWKRSVKMGWVYEVEVRLRRAADNVYRWHTINALPQRDDQNKIKHWIATCTDIDDKLTLLNKLTQSSEMLEEKVQERTNMLDEAQEIASMGSWEWDIRMDKITWSDALYKVYGVAPGTKVTFDLYTSHIHPDDRDTAVAVIKNALSNGKSFQQEYRIIRPDGVLRVLDSRGNVTLNHKGDPIRFSGMCMDITERKKIEMELVRAKDLSENIINHSIAGINSFDRHFKCTSWNKALEKISGLRAEDIVGKNLMEVYPNLLGSYTEEVIKGVMEGKTYFISEKPFPDGKGYFEAHALPMKGDQGKVNGGLIIINDISERKKAEEQIRRNEAQLADAQSLSHLGSWEWDFTNNITFWSDELFRIFGLAPGSVKLSIRTYLRSIPKQDLQQVRDIIDTITKEKKPVNFEHRVIRKDGDERFIAGMIKPFFNESGRLVKLTGFSQDITEKKQKEEEIKRSRDYYLTILEEFPAMIWRTDLEDNCDYFNKAWLNFTGRKLEDELGDGWQSSIHPEDLKAVHDTYEASYKDKKPFEMEYRMRRHDGKWRWVVDFGRPLFDFHGSFTGYLGACYDITDRKESEEKLMEKNRELMRSNAELEQFAYVASHDLKEPLRMVSSYTQLLAQRYHDLLDEEAHEFISFATEGAKRMDTLISDLLGYSRIGRMNKEFDKVDCNEIISIVKNNLQSKIEQHGATINVDKLPVLESSHTYMIQLFQNLIGNSIKFHSDKAPEVRVNAKKEGRNWIFSVSDNGIGIDPQHKERIFIIFQRLHNRGKYPGTGIGLAICKKIVEYHRGKIWVESTPGEGTTFYFSLPETQLSVN